MSDAAEARVRAALAAGAAPTPDDVAAIPVTSTSDPDLSMVLTN